MATERDMVVWTEEELRELRQEGLECPEPAKTAEPGQWNEEELWRRGLEDRDLCALLWGIEHG